MKQTVWIKSRGGVPGRTQNIRDVVENASGLPKTIKVDAVKYGKPHNSGENRVVEGDKLGVVVNVDNAMSINAVETLVAVCGDEFGGGFEIDEVVDK